MAHDLDRILYSPCEPYAQGMLAVDDLHTLYWERCGRPNGLPVLFLHGGPGGGISARSRRFFDPTRFQINLFDQRGSGRSTPLGCMQDNTTDLLIADIERLREDLGVSRWLVFGGSWGSTLGLAYAQAHPERCLGLVLRGIWLGTAQEIDWWLYGIRSFFPREWEAFAGHVSAEEQNDLLQAYLRRMLSDDPKVAVQAARAWSRYEGSCLELRPQVQTVEAFGDDTVALGVGRLEAHYFAHQAFLQPGQLLRNMPRIQHLPGFIAHGRYDVICPVQQAFALHDAWPGSQLEVVPDAGHSSYEPGIAQALVKACDRFAQTGRF